MKKEFVSNSLEETGKIARRAVDEFLSDRNVVLLRGELGAGKTAFSQFVLEHLGAEGPFTSPTFVIVKKYELSSKVESGKLKSDSKIDPECSGRKSKIDCVFHIDCYRIEGEGEILDLGWEEMVSDKSNLVLVEWPERISGVLPEKHIRVKLEIEGKNKRKILINK